MMPVGFSQVCPQLTSWCGTRVVNARAFPPKTQVSERGNESNSSYGKDFPRSYRTPSPCDNDLGKTHPTRSKSRQSRAAGSAAAGREAEGALCQGLAGITRSRGRCNARGGSCFLSPASPFANVPCNSELQHGEHRTALRAAGYQPAQGTKGHRGDHLRPLSKHPSPPKGDFLPLEVTGTASFSSPTSTLALQGQPPSSQEDAAP